MKPREENMKRNPSITPAFIFWLGLWATASLAWIAVLALEWFTHGSTSCPLVPGTSFFGTSSWSWWPPGQVCVWELPVYGETYTVTQEPPTARLGILALLLLWGASILTLGSRRGARVTSDKNP